MTTKERSGETVVTAAENYRGVWGSRLGFGERWCLLVIDFVRAYTDPASPLFAPDVGAAVAETRDVLEQWRSRRLPVVHTCIAYHEPDCSDGGVWIKKAPVLHCLSAGSPLGAFCDGMEPQEGELVITKQYASAFFGTPLAASLASRGVDTVVIVGCTTSGCVRASAVDAMQNGFRPIVVRDCVGDRHPGPHEANLFDIDSKYGDVISKAELMTLLKSRPPG